jgi:hypothetical protein
VQKPVLNALVLADHVYRDVATGKFIICGTIGRFNLRPPPAPDAIASPEPEKAAEAQEPRLRQLKPHEISVVGSTFAYFSLTEVRGKIPLELRYVDLNDNSVVFLFKFEVQCHDPLADLEGAFILPPLLAPHMGTFALELLCSDEALGSRRIIVAPESQDKPEETKP